MRIGPRLNQLETGPALSARLPNRLLRIKQSGAHAQPLSHLPALITAFTDTPISDCCHMHVVLFITLSEHPACVYIGRHVPINCVELGIMFWVPLTRPREVVATLRKLVPQCKPRVKCFTTCAECAFRLFTAASMFPL